MKFIGLVGTNAKASYNRLLLTFMKDHFSEQAEIEILEIKDVPMFNESKDASYSPLIQAFNQKITDADGVIIATPEYNHSIPSSLKSLLEWLSFNLHPLDGKPVMIVGASLDVQGSSRAQLHLRQILDAPGVNAAVMPGYEFLLGQANLAFDAAGQLKVEGTINFLESCFLRFMRFTKVANLLNVPEDLVFEPGDYAVTTVGHNGDLPMVVTFTEDSIKTIDIDTSGESQGIADVVFTRMPTQIIEGQTLNVDIISGASVTSNGVLDGVAKAVKLAGANPDTLRKRAKAASAQYHGDETYETDVVVVGAGGAGLAAAATILQSGKKVIVVEKFPAVGGNTVRTGGPMNAADPTWQNTFAANLGESHTLQEMAAIDESQIDPEYLADFKSFKAQVTAYLNDIEGTQGYLFDSAIFHRLQTYLGGKRTDQLGNVIYGQYDLVKILTDRALESVKWLEEIGVAFDPDEVSMPVGALWRRGHKPLKSEGYAFVSALQTFVEANGGKIITDTPVESLIIKDGQVSGIEGTGLAGGKVTVHAKAVILTTGGFGANTKMLKAYNTYWTEIADENIKNTAYNTSQEKIDRQVANGTLFKADSLEALAEKLAIDPSVFVTTINNYNSYVDKGEDPEFGKDVFDLKVEQAPFYATPRKPAVHHTMGGLKIDTKTHVLDASSQIIPGLYAAGEVAGGIHAGNRLGGNSLTDIFTFGRIAGKTAIADKVD